MTAKHVGHKEGHLGLQMEWSEKKSLKDDTLPTDNYRKNSKPAPMEQRPRIRNCVGCIWEIY